MGPPREKAPSVFFQSAPPFFLRDPSERFELNFFERRWYRHSRFITDQPGRKSGNTGANVSEKDPDINIFSLGNRSFFPSSSAGTFLALTAPHMFLPGH